jgi:hypothetical protein
MENLFTDVAGRATGRDWTGMEVVERWAMKGEMDDKIRRIRGAELFTWKNIVASV